MSDSKVLQLDNKADDIAGALEVLDLMRKAVESGQIIALCAVAIEPDDCTTRWQFATRPVTKLRMLGAVASLSHFIHED